MRHEYIAHLFLVLFNIEQSKPGIDREDNNNNNFSSGNKTFHTVTVLDGIGDLEHFCNWFAAYCKVNDVNNTTVVISYLHNTHDEKELRQYIQNLPETHPLKHKNDIIFQIVSANTSLKITSSESLEGMILAPLIYEQQNDIYKALYVISAYRNPTAIQNLSKLGLPCYFIHELGAPKELIADNKNIHELIFGFNTNNTDICGCFFPDLGQARTLGKIVSEMSDFLQKKLLGGNYTQHTLEQKIKIIEELDLIVGYHQKDRSLYSIDNCMKNSTKNERNPFLFLTGTSYDITGNDYSSLPLEIRGFVEKQVKQGWGFASARLKPKDYKDLLDLLRINSNNKYMCSGDNTLLASIALGKLPIFLHLSMAPSVNKIKALEDFNSYLKSIQEIDGNTFNANEKSYLVTIIKEFNAAQGGYVGNIDKEALDFFAKTIAPYIIKQCSLSVEKMRELTNHSEVHGHCQP